MNRIFALWGNHGVGKTTTLVLIAIEIVTQLDAVIFTYSNGSLVQIRIEALTDALNAGQDIHIVIEIGGIRIGITSAGDPRTNLAGRLQELFNSNCTIIFCSTRIQTGVQDVEAFEVANNYRATWVTNYQSGFPGEHVFLNQRSAIDLVHLMRTMANI